MSLDDRDRTILYGKMIEAKDYDTIARELGLKEQLVKTNFFKLKREFMAEFKKTRIYQELKNNYI